MQTARRGTAAASAAVGHNYSIAAFAMHAAEVTVARVIGYDRCHAHSINQIRYEERSSNWLTFFLWFELHIIKIEWGHTLYLVEVNIDFWDRDR